MENHPLFSIELKNEIINIFKKDPYNTEGRYQANRIHIDGTKGWPDNKTLNILSNLCEKYGHKKFYTTLEALIGSNVIIKEVINEFYVYSLSKEYVAKYVFADTIHHNQEHL